MTKLTTDQIQEIQDRHRSGESQLALAKEYGVHESYVWAVTAPDWNRRHLIQEITPPRGVESADG